LVKDFLATNNLTTLEHHLYSPGLCPADFYLPLKSVLKERLFCDATDIIKNATNELKRASTKWLSGMFPTPLQSLAEVFTQGDYFEGKCNLNICTNTTYFFTATNEISFQFLVHLYSTDKSQVYDSLLLEYYAAPLGKTFPAF
jgi:hypothetical protein